MSPQREIKKKTDVFVDLKIPSLYLLNGNSINHDTSERDISQILVKDSSRILNEEISQPVLKKT